MPAHEIPTYKRIIIDSVSSVILRACGAGSTFLFSFVLARHLGAEGSGLFFLALTVATAASVIGRLGLDNAVLRFVAENISKNDWATSIDIYKKSLAIVFGASAVISLAISFFGDTIAVFIFNKPPLEEPLKYMGFAIIPLSAVVLNTQFMKGAGKIRGALLLEGIIVPLLAVLMLFVMKSVSGPYLAINSANAARIYLIAATMSAGISFFFWCHAVRKPRGVPFGRFSVSTLMTTSIPMLWIAIANMVIAWADIFILGIWTDERTLGTYAIATRAAMMISFILMAINSVTAPRFAAFHAAGAKIRLARLARASAAILTLLATPVTLFFILWPEAVLGVFGGEFAAAAPVLVILSCGQFINVATGSVGYLLLMCGHEKNFRDSVFIVCLINIAMNCLLVPIFGDIGAAYSTAISVATMNIINTVIVYRKLSILVAPIPIRFVMRGVRNSKIRI